MDVKLGKYRHYKGIEVKVLGVVRHSETNQEMVLYEKLEPHPLGKLWVRPKEMFMENVTVNSQEMPRFTKLPD